jgi:hypothetical protein
LRYEDLVDAPNDAIRSVCEFADLPFDADMLEYVGDVDVSTKPHQQRLLLPPTTGLRSWRTDMEPRAVQAFEAAAGDVLSDLGYGLASGSARPARVSVRLARRWYDTRLAAWNTAASLLQRSPVWRRRHPRID